MIFNNKENVLCGGNIVKIKLLFLLICSYIVAFSINLLPSVKHPDSTIGIFNLMATVLFLLAMGVFINKASYKGKSNKILKGFLVFGFLSGLVVYVITTFESKMVDYAVLDILASIQYPFYLLFITPLFGINYLLNINYEFFSALMSVVYVVAFILLVSLKKIVPQNA